MTFENLNILIISPESWGHIAVSKHHYALELSKKNKVFYLNPPHSKEEEKNIGNLTIINQPKQLRGIGKMPFKFVRKSLMQIEIKGILKKTGSLDVVWSFDSSRLYYLDLFGAKYKIAQLVDYTENFHFSEIAETADLCVTIAQAIYDKFLIYNQSTLKINHGFNDSKVENLTSPAGSNQLKGFYIGNLSIIYFDWDAFDELTKNFSSIDFFLIGPIKEDTKRNYTYILDRKNVIVQEPIPANEILSYGEKFDFSYMIYDIEKYPEQLQNSHKLMQYLGIGNSIFSCAVSEAPNGLVWQYTNKDELIISFGNFISQLQNLNQNHKKCERQEYAKNNTYAKQILKIESALTKNKKS